ncbi:dUTP diphosphatase [Aneurinibacillus aneurinilyticus]|uniref:dUTP diphosphatase n=1 Tax=Aneurinibacillus aneurinilyticus TaxID=1391 RepID=A0A848CW94_ANEAE|nr:deoxyuridine 5'-triphosphate nucleotidohydrolase [Aneurinibacillus aneurinilyticus]NMF00024.1 deoxyuridine 5'-triphosphate nucleotidohydrolase [Aneurinibacillus aneurinilyticus]
MSGNSILRNKVPVKIKRLHPDAVIPRYATEGAAGFDLVAVEDVIIAPGETKKVPLGLSFEIPEGYVMYVCMRSGIALKTKLRQPNGIGVIDSDYRGEVAMMFDNINDVPEWENMARGINNSYAVETINKYPSGTYIIRKGDRVAQGIIAEAPQAIFVEVDELGETERGDGGFGSTGVNEPEQLSFNFD